MFSDEPFEPAMMHMRRMLFARPTAPTTSLPAASRAQLSVCCAASSLWPRAARAADSTPRAIAARVAPSTWKSATPTVHGRLCIHATTRSCSASMNCAARSGPSLAKIRWTSPPSVVPSARLHRWPVRCSPATTRTSVSSAPVASSSRCIPAARVRNVDGGRSSVASCFPDQSARGFRTHGTGTRPSHVGSVTRIWKSSSRSTKLSLAVMSAAPRSVSCTIAITGRLLCGETSWLEGVISIAASARASCVCGTCMFISSPSKSALYGVVHERFIRNVLCETTRTRCAISDMRWSDGCRLKITTSPSRSWRSTVSPSCSAAVAPQIARLCRSPSRRTTNRAPRRASVPSGPLRTIAVSSARLCGVTRSGNVRLFAIASGTPSSSMPTYGSPVITVRAVKSVRLPIRFCRTSPCLPSMRLRSALIVFALDELERTNPTLGGCTSEPSIHVWIEYASSCSVACVITAGCLSAICFCSSALRRTMPPSVAVRSSWLTIDGLSVTAGRTCGGTTATAVSTSCRGCVTPATKPSRALSSSLTPSSVA